MLKSRKIINYVSKIIEIHQEYNNAIIGNQYNILLYYITIVNNTDLGTTQCNCAQVKKNKYGN